MPEEKKPFVRTDGDEVTFNLAGLRQAARTGAAVLGTVADDVLKLADRAVDYGKGVIDRAEERMKIVACSGCGTAMTKDAEGPGYSCPNCKATFTPPPRE